MKAVCIIDMNNARTNSAHQNVLDNNLTPTYVISLPSCLNPVHMYGSIRIPISPKETILSSRISLAFFSYRFHSFPKLFRATAALPPPLPSGRQLHTFIIQLDSLIRIYIFFLVSLDLPNWILNIHILQFILHVVHCLGFEKCMIFCIYHHSIYHKTSFTVKIPFIYFYPLPKRL